MQVLSRWARAVLASSVAFVCASVTAQERPSVGDGTAATISSRRTKAKETSPPPSLRVDVNRVFIPVTVTDQNDNKIEGLEQRQFRIFEDGVEQQISEFFEDEAPVSMGLVLDSSRSMREKFDLSRQAIGAFLRLCPPNDEYFLVTVQDRPELAYAFTDQVEDIEAAMAVKAKGLTALYDGMYLAINHSRRGLYSQHALLVLTDGDDNNSRYSESEIRVLIRESGVRIFSVSVLGRSGSLERFSEESGGRAFQAHKLDELPELAHKVSNLIHGEYVLGFTPPNRPRDGKYHTIKVLLAPAEETKALHVTWRHGYYAPVQ
jgi:VWFA-related protein